MIHRLMNHLTKSVRDRRLLNHHLILHRTRRLVAVSVSCVLKLVPRQDRNRNRYQVDLVLSMDSSASSYLPETVPEDLQD